MAKQKTTTPVKAITPQIKPLGFPGEMWTQTFDNIELRVDKLSLKDYRRMKDNDGQVQMLLNSIYNTLLSVGFTIQDDPDDPNEEITEFVRENLTMPRWKGGMSKSIDITNRHLLRSLEEGFRISEIVYRLDEDGKYRLDRLAPRAANRSEREIEIIVDENGNFMGFRQQAMFKEEFKEVTVLNDTEILKCINTVWGEEYGSNYGRSALKAAWYHYDKAHKGMFLNHVGHEYGAVKFRLVKKLSSATSDKDDNMESVLERIGMVNYMIYPEMDYEVEFADVSDAAVMAVGKEMIMFHTQQMSKSLLAQFVDLGTNDTGSRALGESQTAFFKIGLETFGNIILEQTWNRIISDIVKINFNVESYPQFKINPIEDKAADTLLEAFKELIRTSQAPDMVKREVIKQSSERLELDLDDDELENEMMEDKAQKEKSEQQRQELSVQRLQQPVVQKEKVEMSETVTMEITPVESKVRMVDIKRKLERSEEEAKRVLTMKLLDQKDAIVNQYINGLLKGVGSIDRIKINLAETSATYSEQLKTIGFDVFEFGKIQAANELEKAVPQTPATDRNLFMSDLDDIITKQEKDLEFRMKNVAKSILKARRNQEKVSLAETPTPEDIQAKFDQLKKIKDPATRTVELQKFANQIVGLVGAEIVIDQLRRLFNIVPELEITAENIEMQFEREFDDFVSKTVDPTVYALVPQALNMGRSITFTKYSSEIYGLQYSAVLDQSTTDFCRTLHGTILAINDPRIHQFDPPNHFGCRSIWVAVTMQEAAEYGLRVTGVAEDFPSFPSLNTFKDVTSVTELSEIAETERQLDKLIGLI